MTKLDFRWKKNKEWYIVDENWNFKLTDKAPQEAVESFRHYQEQIKEKSKDPNRQII